MTIKITSIAQLSPLARLIAEALASADSKARIQAAITETLASQPVQVVS